MFYAEEPDNSVGSNFNVTPRTNHDMRSDVCLPWTKVFITINGERALNKSQIHRVVTDL